MEGKSPAERQLIKMEEISLEKMSLQQKQRAEQLYHQLGLDTVVNKVLKDFSKSLSGMDRVADKMFGPYDIKARADAVARVTALMTYAVLSEQYNKEAGNLESQITSLAGERDHVRTNYDNLVEKVAEVVGGDYDKLKTDYNELVQRLAEVEHLRSQVAILNKEKAQLAKRYESQIATQKDEHNKEVESLRSQGAERDSKIERLESAVRTLGETIPYEDIRKKLGEELHAFLLKDSKVPDMVIDGVGKFIDFRKYLEVAVETGAKEACKRAEAILAKTLGTNQ